MNRKIGTLTDTSERGFTLVELVVIMVLVGALAAVAAPRFFDAGVFKERGYFDELISATRYAQKLAVASGCAARITINSNGFALDQPGDVNQCGSPVTWQEVHLPSKEPPYAAPTGVSAAPTPTIIFYPSGQADAGPTVTVGSLSFQVHAATGFVERL